MDFSVYLAKSRNKWRKGRLTVGPSLTYILSVNDRRCTSWGGVRKIRWAAGGKGKRGGARVIYYFRDLNIPVFLLAVYKKGEKLNLTMSEREQMRALVDHLVDEYHSKRWANIVQLGVNKDPA